MQENELIVDMDPVRILKNPPLRLLLFFFLLRLFCILGLTFLATKFELIFYLIIEMTVLTLAALTLSRKLRLCLIPFIVAHIFQYVNLVLTGNYSVFDIYASMMVGAGDFDQLLWTIISFFEGILLWMPSLWSKHYVSIGRAKMVAVIALCIATLTLNMPIHRLMMQEYYTVMNTLSDDGYNDTVVYHDSLEWW